jgi:Ni,Fe-hydrogenase III small subunit
VIAVGDCAVDGGMFGDGYGVVGAVDDVVAVDLAVPLTNKSFNQSYAGNDL